MSQFNDANYLRFPRTLEDALSSIDAVLKYEAENPDQKGLHGVIATHELFRDMFSRLLALEAMVKGGAAIKREKNVRQQNDRN